MCECRGMMYVGVCVMRWCVIMYAGVCWHYDVLGYMVWCVLVYDDVLLYAMVCGYVWLCIIIYTALYGDIW